MRQAARTFQDLIVWQKAQQEEFRIQDSEFRRICSEFWVLSPEFYFIAEGFKKKGTADKARFMNIAHGSLEECRYYLILSQDLGYGDTSILTSQLEEVSKLLTSYTNSILSPES